MKAEGRRQKAEGRKKKAVKTRREALDCLLPSAFCLLLAAFCLLVPDAAAQKKPKPAIKESDARKVIAATPGFALRTGAVRVLETSAAGVAPVSVRAEVTLGIRLASVVDESARQDTGVFKQKRWRAVEFRTGDREWEDFDFLAETLGAARVEAARREIETAVTEFEARLRGAEKGQTIEPLALGALTVKQLSPLGSSLIAEVGVEATFRLAKGAGGKWAVTEVSVGGESGGELSALALALDARKVARARAELESVREALERFRRERGFYVVSDSEVVLMDHLSPRFITRVVRIDPWHRPYRYAGTREGFTLSSDGADGKRGTADDVTLNSGRG